MICPDCGRNIEQHYEFCPACGVRINKSLSCSYCGNPVTLTQTYCVNCGGLLVSKKVQKTADEKWRLFPISILLYLTIFVVHIVFNFIFNKSMADNIHYVSIFDSIMILIWAFLPVYDTQQILKFKFNLKLKHIGFFISGIIIGFFVALGIVKFIQHLMSLPETSFVFKLEQRGYSFTAIIFMVAVQPAIIEELAFRGIIYKALEKSLKTREVLIISAFLFAMLHLSLVSLPHLMLLGLFFGYLRFKTGSIWPSVIAHFAHNFAAILIDKYNVF